MTQRGSSISSIGGVADLSSGISRAGARGQSGKWEGRPKHPKMHACMPASKQHHGVFPDDHISPLSLKSTTIMLASRMRLLLALTCSMAA